MPDESHRWYLLVGQEREGPLSTQDVQYLLAQKKIDGGTLIWRKGMENWTRLREVEDFRPHRPPQQEEPPAQPPPPEPPPPAGPEVAPGVAGGLLPKLAALALGLGLAAGGVYWTVFRTPSQPSDDSYPDAGEVRRLVGQLQTADSLRAGQALAELGGRAVHPLIEALDFDSPDIPPGRIKRILVAIGPVAIVPLSAYLKPGAAGIPARIFIVQVLGDIGSLKIIPALVEALDDPSPRVQARTVEALGSLGPEAVPTLLNQLRSPAQELSPKARENLVQAIAQHAGPSAEPALRQAHALEKDPEVKQALADVLDRLDRIRAQGAGAAPPPAQPGGPAQPVDVRVHASAEARATVEQDKKEGDAEQAQDHADRGEQHRQDGDLEAALEEYQKAYELNPLSGYFLIILELEQALADSARQDTLEAEPPPPPDPVTLEEVHSALAEPQPDLTPFRNAPAAWTGGLIDAEPLDREAGRELFLVRSEGGREFVASLPARMRTTRNLNPGDTHTWKGGLQGVRIVRRNGGGRLLPVLLVKEVE